MRADALANRRRVLAAAERVFAELGLDASTEEVARRAGVGIGTVFRHFPTKRDLVENVLLARLEEFTERARAAESDPDVTSAFFGLLSQIVEHVADKFAMASYLFGGEDLRGPAKQASVELNSIIGRMLQRAQETGGVRDDIGADELYFLIRGLAQPRMLGSVEDTARQRAQRVVLDGLRAGRAPRVPETER